MMDAPQTPLLEKWSQAFHAWQDPRGPDWIRELRQDAVERMAEAGLPGRKTEAWKYTPIRLLEKLSPGVRLAPDPETVHYPEPLCAEGVRTIRIANGRLDGALPETPAGLTLLPVSAGLDSFAERMEPLLSGVDIIGPGRVFSALNTAFLDQGLLVHVAESVDAGTLLLRWASSLEESPTLGNFRLIFLLEPGARLELVEQFESSAQTGAALNVLVQAELAESAQLKHVRVQNESDEFVLFTSTLVQQSSGSQYGYSGFDLGGGLVRHELESRLAGPGAQVDINGAFVLDDKRHVDNHVSVDHASPGCRSGQFFRGVLGGASRGVFNGRALIQPGADESSVHQSNANLLLSDQAVMNTKPELEIYADEVEASHGATVGQLDEAAVFYLRSRGLSDAAARRMLTAAFCHSVSDRLADEELAGRIAAMLDAAMPGGSPIGEQAG